MSQYLWHFDYHVALTVAFFYMLVSCDHLLKGVDSIKMRLNSSCIDQFLHFPQDSSTGMSKGVVEATTTQYSIGNYLQAVVPMKCKCSKERTELG